MTPRYADEGSPQNEVAQGTPVIENPVEATPADNPTIGPTKPIPLTTVLSKGTSEEIRQRFTEEVRRVFGRNPDIAKKYHCIGLLEPNDGINEYDLDRVFNSLKEGNSEKKKDVLLVLISKGGSIEPAYQISKICKSFSREQFIVAVPRMAKSAATLIALGADEIHMGPLGHLGPIDPQLGGLPALGVNQALHTIASVSEKYPGSAEMLSRYLKKVLTVEQIGYCERIGVSAEQYAVRLLSTKASLAERAPKIAKELVHEYKHHGFVIDLDEARQHLGPDWVKSDTTELDFAEQIYTNFEVFNYFLGAYKDQRVLVIGNLDTDVILYNNK